ncbi:DUF1302 domain-containing protein [Luteithermobacter gelatinilyticus]|uniref:DUF1302 domain-containing protein n=1 Tax=Luteithermobacter gelatinilyticus TaxID=2582913 RepID=UPI0011066A1E|nr:DUF1302 domain-containing protein [Luteithermobacter gelatinilyticus]
MNTTYRKWQKWGGVALASTLSLIGATGAGAYTSADGTFELYGFVENATFLRKDRGLSKFRNTVQLEMSKQFNTGDFFSSLSLNATLRASYDGVYDLNSDEFGSDAGGPIMLESTFSGGPSAVPHGGGIVSTGLAFFGFDTAANPNDGLMVLGSDTHETAGGVAFGVPVRPCDVDNRGCLAGYMDASLDELRFPEFNDRLDFLREFYLDGNIPFDNGNELNIRLGRQQVVWGRTDLFRVLDVINPVDYSRHNIYDELEDIRIPQWMLAMEYRMGATGGFEDLNLSLVWNFDKFRPSNLGQAGTPYQILGAGSFFRGMKNCWDNGCTVANFAGLPVPDTTGLAATDFPAGSIGIRQVNLPEWELDNTQLGVKVEGVLSGVGFSLNYLTYLSQLPSLHGGAVGPEAFNAFTGEVRQWPYLIAFDIEFPRIHLFGGSLDLYMDSIKSVFRIEAAYTTGEEFANTLRPELFSESDVLRYVIGWDRDTFIPFLNEDKAFLLSAQIFGQHILDHELEETAGSLAGVPGFGKAGIPDWKDNWIATFLIKGWWNQNRLSPQIIAAYDFRAQTAVLAPSVDWLIDDNWRLIVGANFKFGAGAKSFDDCRSCNPWPPFTASPLHADPTQPGSVGLSGFEPLGRFRAGPIGMAEAEDEIQITLRYRF